MVWVFAAITGSLIALGVADASGIISDQSLIVDPAMLIFAFYYAINIGFEGVIWALSCVLSTSLLR